MTKEDKIFEHVSRALHASIEHLDAQTLSRLNRARHRALEQSARPHHMSSWLMVTGVAAIAVVVISIWLTPGMPESSVMDSEQMQYLVTTEALSDEDIELIDELEFYTWLSEERHAG